MVICCGMQLATRCVGSGALERGSVEGKVSYSLCPPEVTLNKLQSDLQMVFACAEHASA